MNELEKTTNDVITTQNESKKLSPAQHRALLALLSSATIGEAATSSGLSKSTINRYLSDPTFSEVYRAQRGLVLQETVAALQHAGVEAVGVLKDSMQPDVEDLNLRLRAARVVLDYVFKGVETERRIREQDELELRLEDLEADMRERRTYGY
jgi:hypothetical protein